MPKRAEIALGGAVVAVGLLIITYIATFHIGFVERADQSILRGFLDLGRPHVRSIAFSIARLCNPQPYVFLAAVPIVVALCRGRLRVALAVAAVLLGANVTTQLLKPLLLAPRAPWMGGGPDPMHPGSWPSGHATAAMSLALCCVFAAPARVRPVVAALGGVFAVAVSYSFLTLGWHYPSDVIGGFLVAATWTLLAISAVLASYARRPRAAPGELGVPMSVREALEPAGFALVAAVALAGLVFLVRPHAVVSYASDHTAFVVGAAGIGAAGLALATGVMLTLRVLSGSGRAPRAALGRHSNPG